MLVDRFGDSLPPSATMVEFTVLKNTVIADENLMKLSTHALMEHVTVHLGMSMPNLAQSSCRGSFDPYLYSRLVLKQTIKMI